MENNKLAGFGRRPRFASNTCSPLHSSPVQFETCVICTLTDIRATWQQVTEIHPDLQVMSKVILASDHVIFLIGFHCYCHGCFVNYLMLNIQFFYF